MIYSTPGLLQLDDMPLSQRGKSVWKGEMENTRLANNERWNVVSKLEETSTNGIPQSVS